MTKILLTAATVAASVWLPIFASAQVPPAERDRLVVSPQWVAQHLHDADLVLLQVGPQETYDAGHIPGARFADYMSLHTMANESANGLGIEMPPANVLHDRLAALGISNTSHVVVYESDEWWSPSTRIVLTLDYAGLAHVSWMDGGLKAWTDSGQPVSRDVPLRKTGALAPLTLRTGVVVDADFVKAHAATPGFALVDARNTEFYDGTKGGGRPPKPGHIPGALTAPYDTFVDGERLKSPQEISAIFTKAGVKPGDTVIGYCHVGQQATAILLAARTVGHPVALYDGSFEDWAKRGLPLENPAATRKDR